MCNLSQGIEEKGIAIGRAEGEAGLIMKMYKNGSNRMYLGLIEILN